MSSIPPTRPFAELHVHLRGTISHAVAMSLAQRYGVTSSDIATNKEFTFGGFDDFLHKYHLVGELVRGAQDYALVCHSYLARVARSNTRYVELMVSPDHALDAGVTYAELLRALEPAIRDCEAKYGIACRLIVTAVRHRGPEAAEALARLVVATASTLVVGFGMCGNERVNTPSAFRSAFSLARQGGLKTTCHVGELCDAAHIREALDVLQVDRLGHAIRSVGDDGLLREIASRKIVVEVCPTSNVRLGLVASFNVHPVFQMLAAGVKVSVNTDDPAFMATTMEDEFANLRAAGMTEEFVAECVGNGWLGAFDPAAAKAAQSRLPPP